MNINSYLNHLTQDPLPFQKMASLLEKGVCGFNFGRRVIRVDGFEGALPLEEIGQKIVEVSNRCIYLWLPEGEAKAGHEILKSMRCFHLLCEQMLGQINPLILAVIQIRELCSKELYFRESVFENGFLDCYFRGLFPVGQAPLEVMQNDVLESILLPKLSLAEKYALSQVSKRMNVRLKPIMDREWLLAKDDRKVGINFWVIVNSQFQVTEPPIPSRFLKIMRKHDPQCMLILYPKAVDINLKNCRDNFMRKILTLSEDTKGLYNELLKRNPLEPSWILLIENKGKVLLLFE